MAKFGNTFIIIPCYNEESRLPVSEIRDFLNRDTGLGLHLVNDGSKDDTKGLLDKLSQDFPENVSVQHLPENAGKAEAVRQGVKNLLSNQNLRYVGYLDADLATPLGGMLDLRRKAEANPDVAMFMGSRVKLHGFTRIRRYQHRHYFGRILATFISRMLHLELYDTQCGAKLVAAKEAKYLFGEPFTSKWLFDVELIYRLLVMKGYDKIQNELWEIPLNTWIEKGGSKLGSSDLMHVPYELYKIRKRYNKKLLINSL